jgi:hypothetical protein
VLPRTRRFCLAFMSAGLGLGDRVGRGSGGVYRVRGRYALRRMPGHVGSLCGGLGDQLGR